MAAYTGCDYFDSVSFASYLSGARSGDREAFCQLFGAYVDLIAECLFCSGLTSRERRLDALALIGDSVWKALPYARRAGDFECLLALHTIRATEKPAGRLEGTFAAFHRLNPIQRFLAVSREMENWSLSSLRRICRCNSRTLDHTLAQLRCQLLGFEPVGFNDYTADVVLGISRCFDDRLTRKQSRALPGKVQSNSIAKEFRRRWLTFRCELIDLRQDLRLTDRERSAFFAQLTVLLETSRMERVGLFGFLAGQLFPLRPRGIPGELSALW